METPVPEAALCFLCLHRLGQQQIKTWVKSGPHNIHTVIWICCLAQSSTDCYRSTNTSHTEIHTLEQLHLLCAVRCHTSHLRDPHAECGSGCWVCYGKKKTIGPACVGQGPVILLGAYSTVTAGRARIYLPNRSCHCPPLPHHWARILLGFGVAA